MAAVTRGPDVQLRQPGISQAVLDRACSGAWDPAEKRLKLGRADFQGSVFEGPIRFARAIFEAAIFRGATFNGPVSFMDARFKGEARFDSATFAGTASFRAARFLGEEATFEHPGEEEDVPEWPEEVTFKRWADFRDAVFGGPARFGGAHFERRARFDNATFAAGVNFTGGTFSRARTIGPVEVEGDFDLDRVVFEYPVRLRLAAGLVTCRATQFQSMTSIDLFRGDINLEETAFAEPATVTGRTVDPKPRVVSLQRANVAHLTLADVDLRACSFLGVHNLDGLRFEGGIDFCEVEKPRRTKRRLIADEVALLEPAEEKADGERLRADRRRAERVARAYRALRKGREDNGDAPGAADFYYGEMEMRRRAATGFERAILTAYWMVSGYGLRAWRALAALVATIALFAWGFLPTGLDDEGYWTSLVFSAESTSSLFRGSTVVKASQLTELGHVLQIGLRLLGPLFLGLAILALRGRVRR